MLSPWRVTYAGYTRKSMDKKRLIYYSQNDAWEEKPLEPRDIEIYLIRWLLLYIEREVSFAQLLQYVALVQKHTAKHLQGNVQQALAEIMYLAENTAKEDVVAENFFALDIAVTDILYGLTDTLPRAQHVQSV
jgi:hypothetical protein